MWQVYICDENGKERPYLKPWKDIEKAEQFMEAVGITPYTIKKAVS